MAETTSGKTAAPTPAKPQPVIAEQPLPDANEAIATNTPLSTPVTAGNDRSVANIHTGNKAEYDPTLVATPDDASSLASNIPTTGFQGNAAPLADASPLGSTNGPSTAGETEPAPVTAPAEGAQVGGNRVALPSSSFTNEVPLTDAGNAATAGTSAASAASTASAVSGGGAGNTDGGGKADDTTVDGNAAVPDVTAPTLTVEATVGDENGNIPVVIDATLSGDNPNEVLTVTVGGLPDGATLSAGTLNPDGTYTLTEADLVDLTLTPATDSGEDFALTVTATATDSVTGVNASTDTQLPVTVVEDETATTPDGIADVTAPTLSVEATVGDENGNIPVVIDASLSGDNPNEVLTVTVGGLPDGATLSAGTLNPDGSYTLTADQLEGLTLTPAADSGDDFALTVTATATDSETGVNASTDTQLPVTVVEDETAATPDAVDNVTAPTLTVEATVGDENGNIPVVIDATLSGDNPNEVLTVTVGGLPDGATLSAGTLNPDGTYTLTEADLVDLTLTPATDSGEDFALTVTATATDSETGVNASTDTQLPVTVVEDETAATPDAVDNVTAPTLTVEATVGDENTDIPVVIDASLSGDNPNEVLTVTVGGLPDGATLSAGTLNPDGSYTLTADQLEDLTLTPATDSGEDFALTVTATATDSVTGVDASTDTQLPVTVVEDETATTPDGIADVTAPTLTVEATVGDENGNIPVVIDASLSGDNPNEVLTVTVGGLPDGATLSAGTLNPDGTYTLSADQLEGLTLTPATDSGDDFALTVTATATDSVTGVDASTDTQLPVTVVEDETATTPDGIADVTAPTLTVEATVGDENGNIPVVIDASLSGDNPNEVLTVTVGGLPDGATLSAGTLNPDGTYTLTEADLVDLTLTPAADSGEDFALTVTATATDSETGVNASTDTQLPVTVVEDETAASPDGIANVTAPTLTVEATVGDENGNIPVVIDASLSGDNPNEVLTVTVGGLPDGATLSAGTLNPDGTYTLTEADLVDLTLTPATDSGEDFALTVTATATDSVTGVNASTDTQLPVTVIEDETAATPDAVDNVTAPTLSVEATVGDENGNIPVVIDASLSGDNPNEVLTVTVGGLPDGATLSAGTLNPDGTYTLTEADLVDLTLTPATDSGEDFALTVTATATDSVTGVNASTDTQLPVTVVEDETATTPDGIADVTAPTLTVEATVGDENSNIPVVIDASLSGDNPNEVLTVTVGGLPDGATLSAGTLNPDGTYTLTADQLEGLTLTPAADSGDDFALTVTATATDSVTGVDATTNTELPVTVIDNTDTPPPAAIAVPTATVAAAGSLEDGTIPLDIALTFEGAEAPAETLVAISGIPDGATLSAGTATPDGAWVLSADQLTGLTLTPADDMSGTIELTITPLAINADDTVTSGDTVPLNIAVEAVADAPTLTGEPGSGDEDTAIPLTIDAALTDIDGSEILSITIADVPDGATLSAGTQNPDGTWTLTANQLADLTLTPPQDFNGDISLTVTATSVESENGDTAETTVVVPVTVSPVLDAPSLTLLPVVGLEDTEIALGIDLGLVDLLPTTTVEVTIDNLPTGATLSAGVQNPDGSYTLTGDDLVGLTLTPPQDYNGSSELTVTAVATDTLTGLDATTTAQLPLTVTDVLDAPSLTLLPVVGLEDTEIALGIDLGIVDLLPTTTVEVTIDNLPTGATLSAGVQNPDGSYTLTGDDLVGLTLTPPQDYNGSSELTVTAVATDTLTGLDATTTAQLPLTVTDVLDAPSLTLLPVVGLEDTEIALGIDLGLVDLLPTTTVEVTIDNLPTGATLSAGVQNPDGSYTLTGDDLVGLTLTPPQDYNGSSELTVTAVATDTLTGLDATTTAQLPLTVTDVLDAPSLTLLPVVGLEDTEIALGIDLGIIDLAPTTTVEVTIDNLPTGATLSAGVQNPDGSYTLTGDDLVGLTLTPPQDYNGSSELTVTAVATDTLTGLDATTTAQLPLTVTDVPELATLTVADPASSAPPPVTLVSVNDWYNPDWGGGFNATFEMTITDEMVVDGFARNWTLDVDHSDPNATFTTGSLNGFNAPVAFDPATGTFTGVGEGTQETLVAGETVTFTVQVQNAGYNFDDFTFTFDDIDVAPTEATPELTDAEFLLALETLESPSIDPSLEAAALDPTATTEPDPTVEPSDATPTAEPVVIEPEPETPIVEVNNPLF